MRLVGVVGSLLISGVALAAVPDHIGMRFNLVDNASIKRLDVSDDERIIVGASGDGRVILLDAESWETAKPSVCDAQSVAIADRSSKSDYLIYVGCANGTLHTLRWSAAGMSTFQVDGVDEVTELAANPLVGTWRGTDGVIYALAEADGDVLRLHSFDPDTKAVDQATAASAELLRRDYREGVIVRSAVGDIIYVSHGGNDFSQIQLTSGLTLPNASLERTLQVDDITPAPVVTGGAPTGVWIADPNNGLQQWNGSTGVGSAVSILPIDDSLKDLRSVVIQYNAARTAVESVILHQDGFITAVPQAVLGQQPLAEFEVGFKAVDLVEGPYGYVIGGTNDGALVVLTANPWVDELTLSPAEGEIGTEVTVTFQSDTAGSWKLYRGGTRSGDGTVVASGDLDEPGEVTATFTVDDTFAEGETAIYAIVTDADGSGHARAGFSIDNPPVRVSLAESNVGFGDRALYVEFATLAASDIDHYNIYITTEEFKASDYPTSGPTSEDGETPVSPRSVEPAEGEARVKTWIRNLDNGVSYYVAVRAVDAEGTEGPMSRVVVGMPRQTGLASELVGEEGGPACSAAGARGSSAIVWLALAGAAALRRRSRALGVVLLGITVGSEAQADEERTRGLARFDRDISPAWVSFEVRHDFQHFGFKEASSNDQLSTWKTLQDAYNPWVSVLRLEVGPQIFRVAEIDFGLGFMTRKGSTLDGDGTASSEVARLQWFPLSLGGTLRAHILDEQPVVPYVGAGIDWVFYREDQLDTDGAFAKGSRLTGAKNGWHWFVGGNILLDTFDRRRAGQLEALTGINDTWLTLEYRSQRVGYGGPGFDFSGWAFGIGLKMDY